MDIRPEVYRGIRLALDPKKGGSIKSSGGSTPTTAPPTPPSASPLSAYSQNAPTTTSSQYGYGSEATLPFSSGGLFSYDRPPGWNGNQDTLDSVTAAFLRQSPQVRAQVQMYLYQSGYYRGKNVPIFGGPPSKDDLDAFHDAASVAARSGSNLKDFLEGSASAAASTGVASPKHLFQPDVHHLQTTATLDLQNTLKDVFNKALGIAVTDKELSRFVGAFHSTEIAKQMQQFANDDAAKKRYIDAVNADSGSGPLVNPQQMKTFSDYVASGGEQKKAGILGTIENYVSKAQQGLGNMSMNAAISGGGGGGSDLPISVTDTTEAPPSPSAAALDLARKTHPKEYYAMQEAAAYQAFESILKGG